VNDHFPEELVTSLIIFDLPIHWEEFLIYACRDVFPLGLPEQFSFITTFRTRKLPKSPWHIIRMSDIQNKPQFVITMNPRKETIEFSILDFLGRLQTLVFYNAPVRCTYFNPLSPELNPICYLLALLAHHFLHVSRIRVKSLTLGLLMSYIYMEHLFLMFTDHTHTTQHSR
jgi:hypothetical protein